MDSTGDAGSDRPQGAPGASGQRQTISLRIARRLSTIRADLSLAVIESGLIILAYTAALSIRFIETGEITMSWWRGLAIFLPAAVVIHLLFNIVFGNYGHVWSYASIDEAVRVVAASLATGFVLLVMVETIHRTTDMELLVPLGVLILGVLLTIAGMGALRFWSRLFSFRKMSEFRGDRQRAIVVGVDSDAVRVVRSRAERATPFETVGFVDPSVSADRSRTLAGLPILGALEDISEIIRQERVDQVIIACADADATGRRLVDLCMDVDVRLRIFQGFDAVFADGKATRDIRDLELSDLLPRQQVETDLRKVVAFLDGRRVLVTGAGGSIGSEIVRQVLGFNVESVIALDHDETHLHDAFGEWTSSGAHPELTMELADIRDPERVAAVFDRHRPHVIFHAAAHKHVPILENCPDEAIKTNIIGTANVIEAAAAASDTEGFVLISTDKAVRPESVMGASKRLAEMLVQDRAAQKDGIRWSAVRFGNVLGSRGSVVPTFTRQVQAGGPVTVSHPDMERYFMTVDEAVELVLQAASMAVGGEVFVLDMGAPVRIMDLANRIIRLAGLVPGQDIEVVITGMRPGERLSEELSVIPLSPSSNPKILLAGTTVPDDPMLHDLRDVMHRLLELEQSDDLGKVLVALANRDCQDKVAEIDVDSFDDDVMIPAQTGT